MKKVFKYFLYVCFSPRGRINRAWWWAYTVLYVLYRSATILSIVKSPSPVEALDRLIFFDILVGVLLIYPSIVVSVKRLHDTNRSGWHVLLGLISMGIYILIVCGFFKGTDGENPYGDPSSLIDWDSFNDTNTQEKQSNERHKTP